MNQNVCALALVALLSLAGGCSTLDVRSSAEPNTDFSRYHTYNYAEPSPGTANPRLTPKNRRRLETEVDAEMKKRGLQFAAEPDLVFAITLETTETNYNRSNPNVDSGSLGANLSKQYALRYDKNANGAPVVAYTEGTLVFRAMDSKSDRLVWDGAAMGAVYENRPDEEVQKRIQEAVKAVFSRFPVKPR
jgi:hypothetical protein